VSAGGCPGWCRHCALFADLPAAGPELHRSAPVAVALPSVFGDEIPVFLELRQQISVHPTEPVLAAWRAGDSQSLLLPLHTVPMALAAVVQLVGLADRDIALAVLEMHAAMRAEAAAERGQVPDGH
jgi:hypothetical protein